ncbi:penicillin-binding protein 2 [Putridiphycobacter roseus]|uniref:Penicillin-binding protein 2 n=1 Tax=Putridiphycobacter roseus TaxID=2219161 RepID=A0A2W1NVU2_9FLAO|nr:penicillin-binding protein 2 [Putridiphycobacter roseus]PZE18938.1 penicillin-binding protein 2 [Putridiphycobacter roseus]
MNNFDNRKFVITFLILLIGSVFIFRLAYMQLIDDQWKLRAAEISENKLVTYPARGIVYDRNDKILIDNQVFYNLLVIPRETEGVDSVEFAKLLNIPIEDYTTRMNKARKYSKRKSSIFEKQISPKDYTQIGPELYKYPGFIEEERTLRTYPKPIGAQMLGYMNEVNKSDIQKDGYYKSGDYIGRSGIEKEYESVLRGKRGVRYILQNAIGVFTGSFENGKFDTVAIQGKNIQLGIDAELQAYGERLMQNKIGCIVAIEPSSGEILSLVTSPTYDPNLLVGRNLGNNYMDLYKDSLKPLFNRASMSTYPPGSTFKLMMALIGLQEGVVTSNSSFPCTKSLVGCHNHPTAQTISDGVKMSCNPYFYHLTKKIIQQNKSPNGYIDAGIGLDIWQDYVQSFGMGKTLPTDLNGVSRGLIPGKSYYDRIYGEHRWMFSTIFSISIGQGEVLVNPIEMANLAAIMANRGYYYPPHFIKNIENDTIASIFQKKHKTKVDAENFSYVVDGMYRVVNEAGGTARRARLDSIAICGKTGTAQNPHGEDHSIFIAFAPKDDPKIAISVYIENAGFGGTWAAPIASLMIEKYLTNAISPSSIKREKRILEANLILGK